LIYLDVYSNRNVSIYQDENTATIYFCSTGSRVEFSGQAAEDWMQSNIAILMGVSTSSFSSRFNDEKRLLDEIVMALRPSIIIFCGHSLGSRLGNELFVYSIEQNKFQPFSIGFNGGSIISVDFTKKYNTEYINHRVLQFHVNYDLLSATNIMGTVVNLPAHFDFSHRMTNFSDFDWSPYENFIETGLQFSPFNPIDEVIPEDNNEPQPPQPPQPPIENLVEDERLGILQPFYERYYPNDIFTPLDDNRPSNAELYSMEKLLFPTTPYPRQNPRYYLSEAFKKDYKTQYSTRRMID